jgi:hypothetical protein
MTRIRPLLALGAALAVGATACGDDGGAANSQKKPAAKRGGAKKKAAKPGASLDAYSQIEDDVRRKLGEEDFRPDPSGDEHRDPFRSYIVRQGQIGAGGTGSVQQTDLCTAKNSKAPDSSLRDLRLMGIVLRGTRGYAQFRDPTGFGWMVRRGDCLGKEKAIVQAIGVGSVTLEVVPEAPPNTAPPPPEQREIPLHPAELAPEEAVPETPPAE